MRRLALVPAALAVALALTTSAEAAIFIRLATTTARRGGALEVTGNASHMPLYALPAARMPCARYGTCSGPIHREVPPRPPFVFIGYTPNVGGAIRTRAFAIRLPRALAPGRYKVFVWCKRCGGSLIVAGTDSSGQTLRVRP